jgi:threonine/homoserine/homoserine lactone efflux protein
MPAPHALLTFALASMALLLVPGPSVIYIVTRSVSQGRSAGIVSMLGIETGGMVHVAAAALGLSAILASSATAFDVVRFAGAGYLIYIGIRRLREPTALTAVLVPTSRRRLFTQGIVVNVLNPKTALFFLAFLPQFIDPSRGNVALQVLLLGAVFISLAVLSDGTWALLAGSVGGWLRAREGASRWLSRVSGGVFIALGAGAALAGSRPSSS